MKVIQFSSLQEFESETEAVPASVATGRRGRYWRGLNAGQPWFYKHLRTFEGVTICPNVVGEVLSPLIASRMGIPHLEAVPVHIAVPDSWIVGTPLVNALSTRTFKLASDLSFQELGTLGGRDLWKLFLFDVIIGNGDRSLSNLFVQLSAHRNGFIPIDHNLALLRPGIAMPGNSFFHFVESYQGIKREGANAYQSRLDRLIGTPQAIAQANPVYRSLLSVLARDKTFLRKVNEFIGVIQTELSDTCVTSIVNLLPGMMLEGKPRRTRRQIIATLNYRVQHVHTAFSGATRNAERLP